MWLLAVTFFTLVSTVAAKYGLYFTGDSSLKYDYAEPVDMANNYIRIDFTIPQAFSESLDVSGLPLALLNISTVQLDSLTIEIHPGNYIFITVLAPDSAQDQSAMGYCMYGLPLLSNQIISLEVNRTGNIIDMAVDGESDNVQCIPISVEPVTGEMNQVQYVTIGYSTDTFQLTSFVGCIHAAVIDGIDLLADTCEKTTPGKSTSNTFIYESDSCPDPAPTASVACPTTEPPTTQAVPKPTTNKSTTAPAGTRTQPGSPTATEEATLPKVDPTPPVTTEEPVIPVTKEPPPAKPETEAPAPIIPPNVVDPDDDYEVVEPIDNNAEGTDEAVLAKATEEDGGNSLITIICVVVGGVILVVILLTVGYKFHFRDKGSYKLEESKNFDNDGFNEYSDLNAPEKRSEEWYL